LIRGVLKRVRQKKVEKKEKREKRTDCEGHQGA